MCWGGKQKSPLSALPEPAAKVAGRLPASSDLGWGLPRCSRDTQGGSATTHIPVVCIEGLRGSLPLSRPRKKGCSFSPPSPPMENDELGPQPAEWSQGWASTPPQTPVLSLGGHAFLRNKAPSSSLLEDPFLSAQSLSHGGGLSGRAVLASLPSGRSPGDWPCSGSQLMMVEGGSG